MQSEKYPHNHPSHSKKKTSIAAAGGKSAYRAKRGFLPVPIVRIRQAGPDRIGILSNIRILSFSQVVTNIEIRAKQP